MTDNLDNGATLGTSGAPTPAVQGGGAPADSGGGLNQEAISKRIAELEGQVRALQREKDRGVQKALTEVGEMRELLARYDKLRNKGLDLEEAADRIELEQLLAERRGSKQSIGAPVQGGGGSPTQPAQLNHAEILVNMGLDPNDPEVTAVLRAGYDDITALAKYNAIANARKARPAPVPNPAQQMPVAGGTSVVATPASLMAEYREMIKNYPPGEAGHKARFDAKLVIRAKAKEAGVESPV